MLLQLLRRTAWTAGAAAAALAAAASSSAAAPTTPAPPSSNADDVVAEGVTYRVYDGRTGAARTLSDVVRAALTPPPAGASGTVLLVGEAHDDAVAHAVERRLLRDVWARAAALGRPRVLCLEMFERDVQGVLDEVLGGSGAVNAASEDDADDDGLQPILLLQKQQQQQQHASGNAKPSPSAPPPSSLFREGDLLRDARPWPNYVTDYRPLVLDARSSGVRVVGANAPRRYVSVAGRFGTVALEAVVPVGSPAREWLAPLPHARASEAYARRIDGAMRGAAEAMRGGAGGGGDSGDNSNKQAGACPYVGFSVSSNFLAAQSLWDATMAWTVAQELRRASATAAGGGGGTAAANRAPPPPLVALVAGRFHIEQGLGVAEHLSAYCGSAGGAASSPPAPPRVVSVTVVQSASVSMAPEQLRREGALGLADFLVLSDGKMQPSFRSVHL
jgi:hypothetical protein